MRIKILVFLGLCVINTSCIEGDDIKRALKSGDENSLGMPEYDHSASYFKDEVGSIASASNVFIGFRSGSTNGIEERGFVIYIRQSGLKLSEEKKALRFKASIDSLVSKEILNKEEYDFYEIVFENKRSQNKITKLQSLTLREDI
ncbi:hypothetical protein [Nonlabens ponticola]|uniref:Uncharacterized protein n=1 Tax=Nonlabens ponticola TaxID=2496866 RepID=A0A3S9MYK6_9FLAO|nr:hypothetical protein [Nonlabens ponticola]AZQ44133.1 hypothetical protein EJ995_07765 [Nonlabens ponticola]